jgi:uncharacterized protein with HEPN domain
MMERDPVLYLRHILDCCLELEKCADLRELPEVPESVVFAAICRNLEIIGEAAGKLGREFHGRHPEIPWRQMISARNLLIHNYDGVDPAIVFVILEDEIPRLQSAVRALIRDMTQA